MNNHNNINITSGKEKTIEEKVDLYINIFGEEPRNEGYIDEHGKLYPLSYSGDLSLLKRFYDKDKLSTTRVEWSKKQGYIESIAEILNDKNELVGFILGRSNSLQELNTEKFNLDNNEYNILIDNINKVSPNINFERLFYAADLGIKPEYRNYGIASKLYNDRHQKILENGEKVVIVRTTKNRPVPYNWYLNKGFQEVYNYNDQQNRVIMILPIQK